MVRRGILLLLGAVTAGACGVAPIPPALEPAPIVLEVMGQRVLGIAAREPWQSINVTIRHSDGLLIGVVAGRIPVGTMSSPDLLGTDDPSRWGLRWGSFACPVPAEIIVQRAPQPDSNRPRVVVTIVHSATDPDACKDWAMVEWDVVLQFGEPLDREDLATRLEEGPPPG